MSIWLPLLSGLVGALIGAAASIAVIVIQARAGERKQRLELVTTLALAHYKHAIERAEQSGENVAPLVLYLHYHLELLKLIERGGISADDLEELEHENTILSFRAGGFEGEPRTTRPSDAN